MLKRYFLSLVLLVVIYNNRIVVRSGGLSICYIQVCHFERSAKRRISGSPSESFSRHFLLMAKRKCHRKSVYENHPAFKNKTPEKELQAKLERNDHTDELASFQKLAAMQNRKWKKAKALGSETYWAKTFCIYACSVCSSVLLSFCAGLGRRIDLVLFGTQRLQQ